MENNPSLQDQIINLRSYVGTLDMLVSQMFRVMEKREIVYREFSKNFQVFDDLSQFQTFDEHELKMNRVLFERTQKELQVFLSQPVPE